MIIYEVNATVRKEISDEYWLWLKKHASQLVKEVEGFKAFHLYQTQMLGKEDTENETYTVHYEIESEKALENYIKDKSSHYRKEAVELFGNQFSISRRKLTTV
jgi:heme-degrading monooxygenase HmoA